MSLPAGHLDLEAGVLRFEGVDTAYPLPPQLTAVGQVFSGMVMDLERDELIFQFKGGGEGVVELGVTGPRAINPLGDRRVVYLDQNAWSAMSFWRWGHRPISPSEAAAAEQLAEMVAGREIVLLTSAGHFTETGPLYGEMRTALAATIIEFGRGWQMRSPVRVRGQELAKAIAGAAPIATDVANLDPDGLLTTRLNPARTTDLPAPATAALARLTNVSSLFATLADPAPIPDEGGQAAAAGWTDKWTVMGQAARENGDSRETTRGGTHIAVLQDLAPEIATAGSEAKVKAWLPRSQADLGKMPYLSRFRAVIFTRLRNAGVWKPSDFTDVNYLCCAAGYADVVVGERRTISDLRAAREVPPGALLARNLAEAVEALAAA